MWEPCEIQLGMWEAFRNRRMTEQACDTCLLTVASFTGVPSESMGQLRNPRRQVQTRTCTGRLGVPPSLATCAGPPDETGSSVGR